MRWGSPEEHDLPQWTRLKSRGLSIILLHTRGLRSYLSPSSLLCLFRGRTNTKATRPVQLVLDNNRRLHFWSELSTRLSSERNAKVLIEQQQVKEAPRSAATATQDSLPSRPQKRWMMCSMFGDPSPGSQLWRDALIPEVSPDQEPEKCQ